MNTTRRRLHVTPALLTAVLTLLAVAPGEARAQWTQPDPNNNNNINNTNTGNVGVGTTAPQSSLHVSTSSTTTGSRGIIDEQTSNDGNGALLIVRKSRAGAAVLNGDSIGNLYASAFDGTGWVSGSRLRFTIDGPVAAGSVPTAMEFLTGNTGTGVERMRITSAGNVGIGMASPAGRLEVRGSTADATAAALNVTDSTGRGLLFVKNNGHVSVGTANAWNSFGVFTPSGTRGGVSIVGDGNAWVYADLNMGPATTTGIAAGKPTNFAWSVRKDAFYGGDASGPSMVMEIFRQGGGAYVPFIVNPSGNLILAGASNATNGNVGVGTLGPAFKLDVGGQVNASAGLCIAGDCKTGWAQVGGASQWTTSSSNIFFNTGNIGVGTTAPAARLAVGGGGANVYNTDVWVENNAHVQGNETLTQGGRGRMRVGTAWGYMGLYAEASSTGVANDLVLGSGSGNVRVGPNAGTGAPAMNFLVPNGNVGIGTTTPTSARLHLHSPSNTYLRIGAPLGQQSAIAFNDDTHGQDIVLYRPDGTRDFAMWTATVGNAFRMTQGGSFGIGTAAPAYKLDVQGGQINASGGLCIAGVCKSDWSQVGSATQWANGASGAISYVTGNVGVGTASPAAKLHVAGGARLDGAGRVYVGTIAAQGARGLEFIEENATTFSIRHHDPHVAWQNLALNPHGGNVGVGTPSPRGRLEVAGGALFLGDMGNASWGDVVVRGRVISASNNLHLSPPGGTGVYIDSNYREAGGSTGPVNLHVSGDVNAGGNITAKYQDVAEWVPSTQKLQAGTVVVLDGGRSNHVLASSGAYDTAVAGVVSDSPGVLLGVAGEGKVKVATTGRVRVKVDATRAPIRVGDLLVTSGTEGVAMKSVPVDLGGASFHRPGTIIGKALEPLASGTGEILVLLSLQ